jgi:hypothetical protein
MPVHFFDGLLEEMTSHVQSQDVTAIGRDVLSLKCLHSYLFLDTPSPADPMLST